MLTTNLLRRTALLIVFQVPSASLHATGATATVAANVVTPISISNESGLSFGDLYAGPASGTVVLGLDGSRTASGGAGLASGATAAVARFAVTGMPGAPYSITLPTAVLLEDGNGHLMQVSGFTSEHGVTGQLGPTGTQALAVGATLEVEADQAVGAYSGSFLVTIDYN